MTDETQLLYLEPDDEITSVVRRLREADAHRLVLVASGRTKATTSAVALRLLALVAAEEGREVVLVADAVARSLAGEAGIPAFASVADANADGAVPLEPVPPRRAPIHVVRGELQPAAPPPAHVPPTPAASAAGDETQAVRLPPPPTPSPSRGRRAWALRVPPRAALGALVALLLLAAAALAAVLPAATITIRPATVAVGPRIYDVQPAVQGPDEGVVSVTLPGTATGDHPVLTPATGTVVFMNYSYVLVEIPKGTRVSASGDVFFTTVERVLAPPGELTGGDPPIDPGKVSVGVVAEVAGTGGNVAAEAIDTVENRNVDRFLQAFPSQHGRRVINPEATAGGAEDHLPVVQQADVDAVVADLTTQLQGGLDERLAEHADRIYPTVEPPSPVIEIPKGLVGAEGEATFELTGTLPYSIPFVLRADVEAAGLEQLQVDAGALPSGTTLLPETIGVDAGQATLNGATVSVQVSVSAMAAADVDDERVRELVAGKTADEARTALADLGEATVDLWPGWVDRVPRLGWRIQIQLATSEAG
jgi:hypothetical protein